LVVAELVLLEVVRLVLVCRGLQILVVAVAVRVMANPHLQVEPVVQAS
jgi:hypothetical protein